MDKETLYIVVGCTVHPDDQKYQANTYFKRGVSVSNSEFERKLLNGFNDAKKDFVFITAPVCGTYPKSSKKPIIEGFKKTEHLIPVRYNCSFWCRNISKRKALIKLVDKIVDNNYKEKNIHIIICELHKPYLKCLQYLKCNYDSVFSTIIIPDLPKHVNANGPIKKTIKKLENNTVIKFARRYGDSFVCFTRQIADYINCPNKPTEVLEGIIDFNVFEQSVLLKETKPIHCLYLGKVDRRNGIEVILETAKLLPDIIFDICGTGDYDTNQITSIANVCYHGFVSQSEADNMIDKCDIMLSPRLPTSEEYLAYSFPSKIFSYISHKKPIISYELPCYKNTIFEKALFFPGDLTPSSMAKMIKQLVLNNCSYPKDYYEEIFNRYNQISYVNKIIGLYNKG